LIFEEGGKPEYRCGEKPSNAGKESTINLNLVFLDLKKAFDTVNHDIILWRLYEYGESLMIG
jgi:hypothetical protein